MKTNEIKLGGTYAVSCCPHQVDVPDPDNDWLRSPGRWLLSDVRERVRFGMRAEVLRIERSSSNRPVIRVALVARRTRSNSRVEDHYDGTKTYWRGITVDEDDNPIYDEVTFEAVIQPSQVICEWDEAVVDMEVRRFDNALRFHPEIIFGDAD